MSEPITHMDKDNYIAIHHKGISYFDPAAYLVCFVHSFKRNDKFIVIILIYSVIICVKMCNWFTHLQPE